MYNPIDLICDHIAPILGDAIRKAYACAKIPFHEIRLRVGQSPSVTSFGRSFFITKQGELTTSSVTDLTVTDHLLQETFMRICHHSVYAFEKELRNGFITLTGGSRVGLAGHIVYENNVIHALRNISSVSIRVASEKRDCSHALLTHILSDDHIRSCAIISPPGGGKTTMLRDLARQLSIRGYRVCVIDERREIAACCDGVSSFDLGPLCDILDGCDKVDGMMWALRSLSPSVMIMDELGKEEESQVVLQGISSGVPTIFSLHAATLQQALRRSSLRILLKENCMDLLIFLGKSDDPGTVTRIYDLSYKEDAALVQNLWHSSA